MLSLMMKMWGEGGEGGGIFSVFWRGEKGDFFLLGERGRGGGEEKLKSAYSENLFCSDIVYLQNYVFGESYYAKNV